jgi:small subunit ribosomal protein S20
VKELPNIKSAKKRVTVSAARRKTNVAARTGLKTTLKKAASAIASADPDNAKIAVSAAVRNLDQAATRGTIHKNQAARRKSRLTKKVNALAK